MMNYLEILIDDGQYQEKDNGLEIEVTTVTTSTIKFEMLDDDEYEKLKHLLNFNPDNDFENDHKIILQISEDWGVDFEVKHTTLTSIIASKLDNVL